MEEKNKKIEELANLIDESQGTVIENLEPPRGVSEKIIKKAQGPLIDSRLYRYRDLAERIERMPEVKRIPTGFNELDELLDGGLQEGELMVLSGPTKMGKTSFCQTISLLQAQMGIPSLWFTLEVGWQELTRKFMQMDEDYVSSRKISDLPIYYPIDNRSLSLGWMERQIAKAKRENGVRVVFIDHLHFLVPLADTRANVSFMVGGIVRELKKLTVILKIPIVLIAHTKKLEVNVMPDINSLRDSSFIAQESDFTVIIWRERFRASKGSDPLENESVYTDRTILSLEANRRNGKTKRMALGMIDGRFYSYFDYTSRRQQAEGKALVKNMRAKDNILRNTKQKIGG